MALSPTNMFRVWITILLVFIAQTHAVWLPKTSIRITNELSNNDIPLFVHCWSHDDDLGIHTLWKTNEWHWQFHNKFLGRTHFVCNFKYGLKEKTLDIYDSDNWDLRCTYSMNCDWSVKDDGFYFNSEAEHKVVKYYVW
ncbi:hypothetical protein ACOSQ2_006610 [Xanthoceras sorbifolium]